MDHSDTHHPDRAPAAARRRFPLKPVLVVVVLVGIALALFLGGHAAFDWVKEVAEKARTPVTLTVMAIAYTILLAIPGLPGLEVGLVMMAVFGEIGIVAVWLCTVVGLNLTFLVGRRIPRDKLERWLKPRPAPGQQSLVSSAGAAATTDTFSMVLDRNKFGRKILQWTGPPGGWRRYLVVAFLLNMPGNFIIGGGGGIALFCGTSDDIKWRSFLWTTILAAMPIPLMFYFGLLTVREVLPT